MDALLSVLNVIAILMRGTPYASGTLALLLPGLAVDHRVPRPSRGPAGRHWGQPWATGGPGHASRLLSG